MGKGSGRKIPDRWEYYTNMGRQIPGTRFIAFKVPLKQALLSNLERSEDHFGARDLLDHCSALGLVIDLTNTNRYYDPQDFLSHNIQYEKLNTEGHVIPKNQIVRKFFKIVEDFLEENKCNDKVIGVHCTHGVNRTGYMICRYMIQQIGVPPDQAIADFDSARGHVQERINYLNDLRMAPWLRGHERPSPDTTRKSRSSKRFSVYGSEEDLSPDKIRTRSRSRSNWRSSINSLNEESYSSQTGYRQRSNSLPKYGWSPYGPHRRSNSLPKYGWSPYGPRGPPRTPTEGTPSPGPLRRKRSLVALENEEPETSARPFKSPKFGKLYYEQYYKGQVLPQYDMDFYQRREGGVGPYRSQPKIAPPPTRGNGRQPPKQYRGPRQYKSPSGMDEFSSAPGKSTSRGVFSPGNASGTSRGLQGDYETPRQRGRRNQQPFSPEFDEPLFSPENEIGRKSSKRFQPY